MARPSGPQRRKALLSEPGSCCGYGTLVVGVFVRVNGAAERVPEGFRGTQQPCRTARLASCRTDQAVRS